MPKILICDDDSVSRNILKEVLLKDNPQYKFLTASNGDEALKIIKEEQFDLLLLDIIMPGKSGFDILACVKKDEKLKSIPVILITALANTDDKINGFELGAADYIVKPINGREACARVYSHLKIKQDKDKLVCLNETILKSQKALIENSKMAAVGNLAAGIAHEFNNILFIMSGYLQMYAGSRDINHHRKIASVLEELVARGGRIANGLLDFAKSDTNLKNVDFKKLIERDLFLLDKQIRDGKVSVKTDLMQVDSLCCYGDQISQVFLNLILNAVDAMKNCRERTLTVSLKKCEGKADLCTVDACKRCFRGDKGCILIEFADTGTGIPAKIKGNLFDPFVTTKGVLGGGEAKSPGKGLGLFVSFGIIKRHGGFIVADSSENKGSIFTVVLPYSSKKD
jgi:signal transduction histidine kinase